MQENFDNEVHRISNELIEESEQWEKRIFERVMKVIKGIFSAIFVFCVIVTKTLIFHTVFNSILLPIFNLNAIDFKQAFLMTIAQWAIFSYTVNEKKKEEEEEFVWFALKSLVFNLFTLVVVVVIVWASKYL